MTHKVSSLNRYFIEEIKLLIETANHRAKNEKEKVPSFKELTLDMRIRWNSAFVMISRFLFCSPIITSLTHDPYNKIKLQYQRLKKLSLTNLDWSILKALENVLTPFYNSTKVLSTRSRPTLSVTQSIKRALTQFLTVSDNDQLTLEYLLKKELQMNFDYYFAKHVSDDQSRATLISAFLDPSTYRFLTCDEKAEAEAIISNEAPTHYGKLLPLKDQSSAITSSNGNEQDNQLNSLQNLFEVCGIPVQSTSSCFKPSTIKEEIAQYIATLDRQPFSTYWNNHKERLPILSSIVRRYNIMCGTSIDCESAFSVARHIHRKNRSSLAPSTLRYTMLLREYYTNKKA